jgi:uncharacterized protein
MTERLLSDSTPKLRVDGQRVDRVTFDVQSLRIDETVDGLKTLELQLLAQREQDGVDASDTDLVEPKYLDGRVFDFGKRVEVLIGPDDEARVVFDGRVTAMQVEFEESVEPCVRMFAEDALMQLRWTRRVQSWVNMTDADIARQIADRHGLEADVDVQGPTWPTVQQWNMSDLAFLRERARLLQAEVWIERGRLCFKSRSARTGTELTLVQGDELLMTVARADLAHQRTGVRVRGWDAGLAEEIDVIAEGSLIRNELGGGGGRTGPELLEQAFGKRGSVRVREAPHDREQAQAIADAELRRRARAFVRVSGVTRGSPSMQVGSRLTLQRVGRMFEGSGYYVREYCHTYDRERGFRTTFEAERATIQGGSNA